MQEYLAKLGDFIFSTNTAPFQEQQRTDSYKWNSVERIGNKPAKQFSGFGGSTTKLVGTLYPHYKGGLGQIAALRRQAGQGKALPLHMTDTKTSEYLGLWCIEAIMEKRSNFQHYGAPLKIEFEITISEYSK